MAPAALRLAFVGKGGAGKSTIVGTFARLLARSGDPVLVLDSDVLPGLSVALGIGRDDAFVPDDAVEEGPEDGPRFQLRAGLTALDVIERHAAAGPDGVRLLQAGKSRGSTAELIRPQHAFRQVTRELPADRWHVVGDLPGGTRQPFFGWGQYADTVVVVVEPTAASQLTARRLARLQDSETGPRVVAVANKVRDADDPETIAAATGLALLGAVPWDPAIEEAERAGIAVLDHAPADPAVTAVRSLVSRMREDRS